LQIVDHAKNNYNNYSTNAAVNSLQLAL